MIIKTIEEALELSNVPAELRPHVTDTMRGLARNYGDPLALKAEVRGNTATLRNDAGDRSTTINVEVWKWVQYLGLTVPHAYDLALKQELPVTDWAVYRSEDGKHRVMGKKAAGSPEDMVLDGEVHGTFDDAMALMEKLSDEQHRGTPA